ncbi:MAG: ATP-binding protein [Euryarchaeota archaeon]|nr:ATP-binding protein [Euryarchaeota archaeon]
MADTLKIPIIIDGTSGFKLLFDIWDKCNQSADLIFDFSECNFIKQNGVAFLAGLAYHIRKNGGVVSIDKSTIHPKVGMNLAQNGFLKEITEVSEPWDGNSVPLMQCFSQDINLIEKYLEDKWIGKGWIRTSTLLSEKIIGNVLELYENAFEHSYSDIGVFTCGQRFPKKKDLILTIIDFGIGIPQSLDNFFNESGDVFYGSSRLETAFQDGFSTKRREQPRGIGLDLLKEFIQKNHGRMDIYSNNEYACITSDNIIYMIKDFYFNGTAVNIKLKCDEKYYLIEGEPIDQPYF